MADRAPKARASYDAVATTPRPPTPPTTTGRPRSDGLSRCSTAAKKASRSRCRMLASRLTPPMIPGDVAGPASTRRGTCLPPPSRNCQAALPRSTRRTHGVAAAFLIIGAVGLAVLLISLFVGELGDLGIGDVDD